MANEMARRQAALIRGINVGRAKRVAMADLRAMVADLGYGDVRTLLNSGNLVYSAPGAAPDEVAARIEARLAARLGVAARVTTLTAAELDEAVASNPLLDVVDNPARLLVAFLAHPADRRRLAPLMDDDWAPEALALGTRVAYLWCPEGVLASSALGAVGRALGDAVTSRTWATVLKLHALATERGR